MSVNLQVAPVGAPLRLDRGCDFGVRVTALSERLANRGSHKNDDEEQWPLQIVYLDEACNHEVVEQIVLEVAFVRNVERSQLVPEEQTRHHAVHQQKVQVYLCRVAEGVLMRDFPQDECAQLHNVDDDAEEVAIFEDKEIDAVGTQANNHEYG